MKRKRKLTASECERVGREERIPKDLSIPKGGGIIRIKCGGGYRILKKKATY